MPEPVLPEAASRARGRAAFWIDDVILDTYAPVMRRSRFGMAALSVYTALARRADRDGASWPSLRTLAAQAATSERTVQRAIQLLEALGLVAVASCYEEGSQRQTSNRYTLLTPPPVPPALDPDPTRWPTPVRRTLVIPARQRSHAVPDARQRPPASAPANVATPRQAVTPPPASQSPRPRQAVTPSPVSLSPQEGTPREGIPVKDGEISDVATAKSFPIVEVGLSSGQVWAATLAELARRNAVNATELVAWLRPAALSGRDGDTLLLGAPNRVTRDRIAARHLPAVRAALATVLGTSLPVTVVVAGQPTPQGRYPGIGTRPPPNEWRHGLAQQRIPRKVSS
ncbi:MAG: helix-turn-helix domain-containing protein [Chloroflexota bacterium]|nr:helix-turn-helix domain-containing protein [Chloroflexota bacterium]